MMSTNTTVSMTAPRGLFIMTGWRTFLSVLFIMLLAGLVNPGLTGCPAIRFGRDKSLLSLTCHFREDGNPGNTGCRIKPGMTDVLYCSGAAAYNNSAQQYCQSISGATRKRLPLGLMLVWKTVLLSLNFKVMSMAKSRSMSSPALQAPSPGFFL